MDNKRKQIKANSGVFYFSSNIKIYTKKAIYDSKTWYLEEINIKYEYKMHLALITENQDVSLEFIEFL